MTYHALNTLLQGRNNSQRKIAHNTYALRLPTHFAIKYHSTHVLVFHPDGRVVFNTNGWRTSTTKLRLNKFGPPHTYVHQHKFNWFITTDAGTEPFYDGITLQCPTVTPLGAPGYTVTSTLP
jgi:hypothetical protein